MFLGVIPGASEARPMPLSGDQQTADKTERKIHFSPRHLTRAEHSRTCPPNQIRSSTTYVANNLVSRPAWPAR